MSAPREVVPESFVNMAPGPMVHGLTLGEMARFVNQGLAKAGTADGGADEGLGALDDVGGHRPRPGFRRRRTSGSPTPPSPIRGSVCSRPPQSRRAGAPTSPFLYFGAPWIRPSRDSGVGAGFRARAGDLHTGDLIGRARCQVPRPGVPRNAGSRHRRGGGRVVPARCGAARGPSGSDGIQVGTWRRVSGMVGRDPPIAR